MSSHIYVTPDKDVRQLRGSEVDAFAPQISGGVLTAADAGYDEARKVWNATVDRRPALIARCLSDRRCSGRRALRRRAPACCSACAAAAITSPATPSPRAA